MVKECGEKEVGEVMKTMGMGGGFEGNLAGELLKSCIRRRPTPSG